MKQTCFQKNKISLILLLTFLFCLCFNVHGQDIPQNVNVNELSNSQVKEAKQALDNSGLSREAAIEIARQKGATEQQIQDMLKRMDALDQNQQPADNTSLEVTDQPSTQQENSTENKEEKESESAGKKAPFSSKGARFGSYLFRSPSLTFEPSPNIPTPKNYTINIGDQLLINIWGNSQTSYQLPVDRNGQIRIPDIGPVYVAGLSFEEVEKKLTKTLSTIYADMKGEKPKTFAQIDLGKMRSIKINIVGEASTPGTYTLPATATVFNALFLSGGPDNIGSFRNIRLIRNNKTIKTIDIYKFLLNGDESDNESLQDEDIIFIPAVEKEVKVIGEFKRNAVFELKNNESLSDLILFTGGYTDKTYLYRMKLYRKTQNGSEIIDILQSDVPSFKLENGDLLVASKVLDTFKNKVSIEGSVFRPGDYELTPGLKLSELIQKADSITPDAYFKGGHILRTNNDMSLQLLPFTLKDILAGINDIELQNGDQVIIKSHFQMKERETISISGEVNKPFTQAFITGMTLRDAIYMANGFKEGADSSQIEVSRRLGYEKEAQLSDTLRALFKFTLPRDLNRENPSGKFQLQPYDQIYVRRAPGYHPAETVTILGEVKFPGSYVLDTKNLHISDLIEKSGGLTSDAYLPGAVFQREGAGNIGIDLEKILYQKDNKNNLLLVNGDLLTIPIKLQTVKVTGKILNPMSLTYEPGKTVKHYIELSGGFADNARKNKIYIKYPNGTTAITKTFIFRSYPEVKPGSQIVVPLKPEKQKIDQTGKWLSIASTLSTIAVAVSYFLKP